jgi:uroporphyrinogen decarboxylase
MLEKLSQYYDIPQLSDSDFFSTWVGDHIKWLKPTGTGQFHEFEEEIEPGHWRDGWGIIWDTRGLYGEGEWGRPVNTVLSTSDLDHFTPPPPPRPEQFSHFNQFISEHRGYFIMGYQAHLFEVAWALRGMQEFLLDLVMNPDFVHELLDLITEHYLAFIEEALRYDIDAFTFGDDWGSQNMGLIMGPDHWRRFLKPRLAQMFQKVKEAGKFVWLHSDGQVEAVFDDLIEIGLDVYHPLQPEIMDVYALKSRYGDRLCFHGGIGVQEILPFGTPQDVKSEVSRLINEIGHGGGYILAPAHSILADVPVENIVALIDTLHEQ